MRFFWNETIIPPPTIVTEEKEVRAHSMSELILLGIAVVFIYYVHKNWK